MKYARFEYRGIIYDGAIEDGFIVPIKDSPFQRPTPFQPKADTRHKASSGHAPWAGKSSVDIKDIKFLAPVTPSKIIAVGLNYLDHAEEFKMDLPKEPLIFLKPPTTVIGPGDPIYYPEQCKRLDYEAEMAIVIKAKGRNISRANAKNYIYGYTCLNDVTARDLQKKDGQWTRAKSFDTFCPIGPHIVTDIDVSSVKIESFLNGKIRQSSNTSKMIFSCERLVEFISGVMSLEAGDIIATGTPGGIGPMAAGDEIEVRIEKIGSLINGVIKK